jgi:transcriptional regulator with XRE-family HTH domain
MKDVHYVSRLAVTKRANARKGMGRLLRKRRLQAKLGLVELAELSGMSPRRGPSRLAAVERGERGLGEDQVEALAKVLGIREAELWRYVYEEKRSEEMNAGEVERRRMVNLISRASFEAQFIRSLPLLLQRTDEVLASPALSGAPVMCAGFSLSCRGAGTWSVGSLLETWMQGHNRVRCQCCGGTLLIYWLSGSLGSPPHAIGFCEEEGVVRGRSLPRTISASAFIRGVQRVHARTPLSNVGIDELCAHLGGVVDDVVVRDRRSGRCFTWKPGARTIVDANGIVQVRLGDLFDAETAVARIDVDRKRNVGPPRNGGRVVIGNVAPLQFGASAWTGFDTYEITDASKGRWTVHPGFVLDDRGEVLCYTSAPLPPVPARSIVGLLVPA